MKFNIIFKTARQIVIELLNQGIYEVEDYKIYLNNQFLMNSNKVIQSINDLKPNTRYSIYIESPTSSSEVLEFATDFEFVTLNVKRFGAKGDKIQDDTVFIQSAINSCPKNGRVYLPKGTYKVTSLFLKSDITIELAKDATVLAIPEKDKIPVLPGLTLSYDEKDEYNLGTWEGNPLDMYAAIITGLHVSNVTLCGQGAIDGNASHDNWWANPKNNPINRPRLIFLNHCSNISIHGITLRNSPSWSLHPYFSNELRFIDLSVINPKDSPNTDGINPESCKDVDIVGVYFSLGDDCIALKSGKIYMGAKYKKPSENITIRQCNMHDGHGAVTIGSEIAGGVKNVKVTECRFDNTDRGLRLKTRRGRGENSVVEQLYFNNIEMNNVLSPFVINMFYFCDPDGHTEYVRRKDKLPVDDKTPSIKNVKFENIKCVNSHYVGGFFYGLPESKISKVVMNNVYIDFAKNAGVGHPAMMDDMDEMSKVGIYAQNIQELELSNVLIKNYETEKLIYSNVDNVYEDKLQDK